MPTLEDPPQHLLGGLNVAILAGAGADLAQLDAARTSLETLGVTVLVVGLRRGPVPAAGPTPLEASQGIATVDPASLDGLLVLAGSAGAQQLAAAAEVKALLAALDAEGKPIGALGDGVLPLLTAGLAQARGVSTPDHLAPVAQRTGAVREGGGLAADGNVVSAASPAALDEFNAALKQLLARRRLATVSPGNDTPSAVGEDG
ncbi:MAG TPA: DJ-1/PfpI family protein [Ramlibacter sp.]|jgi:protease I|uniref:DJ-1/PfpI family protein n=1 Tax=Ramlibacter sp. TaxID=1917967 RepID=UPI002D644F39|nr:DJ-1/PfpI family protein [Ramlibacter sp.]HZY19695.1 DJ-1/PfpI family protein [Ramlibacter sp.]